MSQTDYPDLQTLFGEFQSSKRGRTRTVTYQRPCDRLIDSLKRQIDIVHLLQQGRDPKQKGHKVRKMFSEEHGRYIVQIKYNEEPLNFLPDRDTAEVESLSQVEKMLTNAITAAQAGYFDDQINRIAKAWSEMRRGRRSAKEPEPLPLEEGV